jgi:hypothetical protein
LLTTVIASAFIFGGAEYLIGQYATVRANPLGDALGELPASTAAAHLEAQRQHMILMVAATKSFKVVGTPTTAHVPVQTTPATTGGGTGSAPIVPAATPNPGTAQSIAYKMLASFGFSTSQFGCLDDIWTRESGWRYNAANASGAYGIPQALPGSKMASAGADWETNPATQIKWGLGYIKDRYGTPCDGWAFWQAHGWY